MLDYTLFETIITTVLIMNDLASCYTESLQVNGDGSNSGVVAGTGQTNLTKQWKPRENVLVASVREHTGAVQRLAVSQDHSFFLSASSDKTVRVWQTKNVDSTGYPT